MTLLSRPVIAPAWFVVLWSALVSSVHSLTSEMMRPWRGDWAVWSCQSAPWVSLQMYRNGRKEAVELHRLYISIGETKRIELKVLGSEK